MTVRPPRIAPLPLADCDDTQLELLRKTSGTGEVATHEWYRILVRHPALHRSWLRFGAELLVRGTIPDRDREIAVLRTAWHCRADFYFGAHVTLAHEHGLTGDDVEKVVQGPAAEGWTPQERTVLTATDELLTSSTISEQTWAELAKRYTEQQLIELPFLVGHYQMVGYAQRSFGIEAASPEQGLGAR